MKMVVRVAVGVCLLMLVYFGYAAVTTNPVEGDSLAYHIPIAKIISDGAIWDKSRYTLPWFYYPSTGEALLAVVLKTGLNMNIYGVLEWIIFLAVVIKMAKKMELASGSAVIVGIGIGMMPVVLRLILSQTVDMWLAIAWGFAWLLLQEPKRSIKYGLLLGMALGALLGMKYSGGLFGLVLLFFYGKKLFGTIDIKTGIAFLVTGFVCGGFWYVRNWVLTGNPAYPLGEPGLRLTAWQAWMTMVHFPKLFFQSLISEYLGYVLVWALPFWKRSKLVWLGIANVLVYAVLPSWPENVLSDLRYTLVIFIPLILSTWVYFDESKKKDWWVVVVMVNMMAVLPQLDYKPKLLLGVMIIWAVILWMKKPVVKV